jgi:hypothetical protein
MPVARSEILPGYEVISADSVVVGHTLEVRENDVLIKNDRDHDVYLPLSVVEDVSEGKLTLGVTADQVANNNWPEPPGGAV